MRLFGNIIGLTLVIAGITTLAVEGFTESNASPLIMPAFENQLSNTVLGSTLFIVGTLIVLIARNRAKS